MKNFLLYDKAKKSNQEVKNLLNQTSLHRWYKDQLWRAINGMLLNIAEGGGRRTARDKRRFFVMARGSAEESLAIIEILEYENTLTKDQANINKHQLIEIIKILSTLIRKADN